MGSGSKTPNKNQRKKKVLKVVHIGNPTKVITSPSEFKATVQYYTGCNSNPSRSKGTRYSSSNSAAHSGSSNTSDVSEVLQCQNISILNEERMQNISVNGTANLCRDGVYDFNQSLLDMDFSNDGVGCVDFYLASSWECHTLLSIVESTTTNPQYPSCKRIV